MPSGNQRQTQKKCEQAGMCSRAQTVEQDAPGQQAGESTRQRAVKNMMPDARPNNLISAAWIKNVSGGYGKGKSR